MEKTPLKGAYGSPEYYSDFFADILADVQPDEPERAVALLQGFIHAINDWSEYHKQAHLAFEELRENLLNG